MLGRARAGPARENQERDGEDRISRQRQPYHAARGAGNHRPERDRALHREPGGDAAIKSVRRRRSCPRHKSGEAESDRGGHRIPPDKKVGRRLRRQGHEIGHQRRRQDEQHHGYNAGQYRDDDQSKSLHATRLVDKGNDVHSLSGNGE